MAAERLPELRAVHPALELHPIIEPPASRLQRAWTREDALVELVRGRMTILGPTTASDIAASLSLAVKEVDAPLSSLEADGSHEIASACGLEDKALQSTLARLVTAGLITSNGFGGLRALLRRGSAGVTLHGRAAVAGRRSLLRVSQGSRGSHGSEGSRGSHGSRGSEGSGVSGGSGSEYDEVALGLRARSLLRRYGVVFRRLLTREPAMPTWRDLVRVYRRLEARGEIRGGRFVSGMSGEQFALPEAVERLRGVRRTSADGRLIAVSAADPLNLAGIVTSGGRIRVQTSSRVLDQDGIPLAAMEGDYVRPLTDVPAAVAPHMATALAGRTVPSIVSGYVGRTG